MKKELSKSDTYAIYHMVDAGNDPKTIAKELDLGIKIVKDVIEDRKPSKNDQIKTTSAKVSSKDMMIRETSAKGNKSVAIMTKEASQINDSFKQSLDQHLASRSSKNAIYRPNDK
jgi:hypothetical protein